MLSRAGFSVSPATDYSISLQGHLFPPPPAHASTAEDYPRNRFLPNRNIPFRSGISTVISSEVFIRFFLFDSLRGKDRENYSLLHSATLTASCFLLTAYHLLNGISLWLTLLKYLQQSHTKWL